jgi:hypothetical protein
MQILSKKLLEKEEITWVEPGQSVGLCQGMALNRLSKEYPTNKVKPMGWWMPSRHFSLEHREASMIREDRLYYLIERRVAGKDGSVSECLIAFQENGDSIEGTVIFK